MYNSTSKGGVIQSETIYIAKCEQNNVRDVYSVNSVDRTMFEMFIL